MLARQETSVGVAITRSETHRSECTQESPPRYDSTYKNNRVSENCVHIHQVLHEHKPHQACATSHPPLSVRSAISHCCWRACAAKPRERRAWRKLSHVGLLAQASSKRLTLLARSRKRRATSSSGRGPPSSPPRPPAIAVPVDMFPSRKRSGRPNISDRQQQHSRLQYQATRPTCQPRGGTTPGTGTCRTRTPCTSIHIIKYLHKCKQYFKTPSQRPSCPLVSNRRYLLFLSKRRETRQIRERGCR